MWCIQCNKHLSECICPDLNKRLDDLVTSDNIFIAKDALKTYREQANRNEWPEEIDEPDL